MSISIMRNDWQPMPVPSTVRAFAIGDVHGLSRALRSAFLEVARRAADGGPDHLVMLGDYIDRGPHSRGVMAQVIAGIAGVKITALAGNHEGVMAAACDSGDPRDMHLWLANGGSSVMNELGLPLTATAREAWAAFSEPERRFIDTLGHHHLEDGLLFIHAGLNPFVPLTQSLAWPWRQIPRNHHDERNSPFWVRDPFLFAEANPDGLFVIHGHTPEWDDAPALTPHRLGLDLGSAFTGRIGLAEIDGDRVRLTVIHDSDQPARWRSAARAG
ncbi:hypothetical protein D3874_21770 [Oleomonas cavernae]|uniref:Calcineurin-like phosphoesterase domain-containing protein n=1 Tax=Oleomonas cavernae TaxID=2320859 RepID=A0A418WGV1_9PROT|nr:metallophosphoesterase [Oleomonas cavernae]RJF80123.1 hypothetical protein D3874_27670 [Oleomonas cavernae]RJF89273.1 hypothetical protein D3874_21770 [Oleomonas cavernae]